MNKELNKYEAGALFVLSGFGCGKISEMIREFCENYMDPILADSQGISIGLSLLVAVSIILSEKMRFE